MYITPRVLISQEFTQLPVYRDFPLPAFIIGPNYALTRYSEISEKPFTALATLDGDYLVSGNSYDPSNDVRYDIPNIPAGGDVDPTYTKVYAEAVEAQYFPNTTLATLGEAGDTLSFVPSQKADKWYPNKVRFTQAVLRTENGFNRSEVFSDRDVAIGDVIELTNGDYTLRAHIKAIEPETYEVNPELGSVIGPAVDLNSSDFFLNDGRSYGTTTFTSVLANFDESTALGQFITIEDFGARKIVGVLDANSLILDTPVAAATGLTYYIGGVYNDKGNAPYNEGDYTSAPSYVGTTQGGNATVTIANSSTSYVGYLAKAVLSDTYTVTVTTGGPQEEVLFSIKAQNDVFTTKTNVPLNGSHKLVVDDSTGNYIELNFTRNSHGATGATGAVLATTFVEGDAWSLDVVAPVTQVIPQTDGEYTGVFDLIYRIAVIRGGAFYDESNIDTCAKLLITASDLESSSVVLPKYEEYFNLGSFGVTAGFGSGINDGGFVAGDVYYVPVKAATKGPSTIAVLSENLPVALLATTPVRTANEGALVDATATLYLTQKSIQIPQVRDSLTGDLNWTQESSYITINAGITTYSSNMSVGGISARLPLAAAKIFVEHRDLLQDAINAIDSVRDLADVHKKLGVVHPDNPLAQGVYDAVLNSANQIVYFLAVGSDDLLGYTEAIKISEKSDKVYSFVPMTFDRTIQDAIVGHVNAYSTAAVGRWRVCWLSVRDEKTRVIYDLKEDTVPYTATITDDPAVSGIQYRLVTMEGASFIDDEVRPNDTVRLNYRNDADGKVVYDEYVVDHIRSNTTLTITKPLRTPINVPVRARIVRHFTKSERAYNLAHIGGDYNNRRVRMVFPDTYKYGGVTKQGYFAAAGLAGLRSGVVPHQGLTNSEFLGADELSKVVIEFTQDDLNTMAEQGIWIITQEVLFATPYVRHQLTTDTSGLNTSEDSITTNVDSISYALKATLAPYIGRYNVNDRNIAAVRDAIIGELRFRATETATVRAGNQLTSFTPATDILKIEQDATYKDRINIEVRLNVPYPLNYINLKLIV